MTIGWLDGVVILAYLGTLVGIGAYFSRRQKNIKDYFLAGRGMGWLPVGMSLMAALNSGIDYLMGPFTVFKYGLIFLVSVTSWVILYPWVAHVTLPFYRRLNIVSAYEYLEQRFNSGCRTLAASIFLIWRLGWMSIALYVPSLAISQTLGGDKLFLPTVICLGGLVMLYTMLGGITAIIWTDVLQFCIMLTGVLVTLIVCVTSVDGGIAGIWSFSSAQGATTLVKSAPQSADTMLEQFRFFFTDPRSVIGILLASVIGRATIYTAEQATVQRFKATRSLKDARQAFIVNSAGDALWTVGLAFTGLALFTYFKGSLPAGVKEDALTIHFMREVFPTGLNGLVVAAVLASGLSSIDAALNAGTSVIMVDFYNRLYLKRVGTRELTPAESRAEVRTSRIVTVCFAAVAITLAANVPVLGKDLLQLANTVIQTFTGPLFAIFLLGMFTERARGGGVFAGGIAGALVALYLSQTRLWGALLGALLGTGPIVLPGSGIGFIWPSLFGMATVLVVGYVVSLLMPGRLAEAQRQLTWRNVMRRPQFEAASAVPAMDSERLPKGQVEPV